MARKDTPLPRATLADTATERLRDAILNGEMRPGEKIQVTGLEQRYGVSHIPIREALRRLETEGLVIALPQRAAVVAGVDLEDLLGLYDLRRMIEVPASRRAVERAAPEDVERVWLALDALEQSPTTGAPEFWQTHREFHWALLQPGATPWIKRTLDQLWAAAERYVRLFVSETAPVAKEDHRRLAELFEAGDGDETEALTVRHLKRTEMAVRRGLSEDSASD